MRYLYCIGVGVLALGLNHALAVFTHSVYATLILVGVAAIITGIAGLLMPDISEPWAESSFAVKVAQIVIMLLTLAIAIPIFFVFYGASL